MQSVFETPIAEPAFVNLKVSYAAFKAAGCNVAVLVQDPHDITKDEWVGLSGSKDEIAKAVQDLCASPKQQSGAPLSPKRIREALDLQADFTSEVAIPLMTSLKAPMPTDAAPARIVFLHDALSCWKTAGRPTYGIAA